eukprot:5019342-Pyramimonas_sp.AAC.1
MLSSLLVLLPFGLSIGEISGHTSCPRQHALARWRVHADRQHVTWRRCFLISEGMAGTPSLSTLSNAPLRPVPARGLWKSADPACEFLRAWA